MIRFECPHCGRQISVNEQYAGKTGQCKACGRSVAIPTIVREFVDFDSLPEMIFDDEEAAPGTPRSVASKKSKKTQQGVPAFLIVFSAAWLLVLFLCCGGFGVFVPSGNTARDGRASAKVLDSQLVPFRNPAGHSLQQVKTTWKNTGSVPIRAIDARFTFFDEQRRVLESVDYTLFAVFDSQPGVLPGETFTTPSGEGFTFPNRLRPADSVEVTITKVMERSGL